MPETSGRCYINESLGNEDLISFRDASEFSFCCELFHKNGAVSPVKAYCPRKGFMVETCILKPVWKNHTSSAYFLNIVIMAVVVNVTVIHEVFSFSGAVGTSLKYRFYYVNHKNQTLRKALCLFLSVLCFHYINMPYVNVFPRGITALLAYTTVFHL